MPAPLTAIAHAALRAVPLSVQRIAIRRDPLALLYHALGGPELRHVRHLYPCKTAAAFENDLVYLARRFRLSSYDEIASGAADRRGRPRLHVTFDDGYAECETVARSILLRLGVPCTFFVTTDWIDNRRLFHRNKVSLCLDALERLPAAKAAAALRHIAGQEGVVLPDGPSFRRYLMGLGAADEPRIDAACVALEIDVAAFLRDRRPYLTRAQVHRLAADGFTIGAHGQRHLPIGGLPRADAEREIVASCAAIRDLIGHHQVPFAFPHSADGVDRGLLRALQAAHPHVGLLFGTGRLRRDDPVIVNRITVDEPPAPGEPTNLPRLLRSAYAEEAAAAIRRLLGRRR